MTRVKVVQLVDIDTDDEAMARRLASHWLKPRDKSIEITVEGKRVLELRHESTETEVLR